MRSELQWGNKSSAGLVEVLDRVLDKGLVVAGDIKVSLAEVELLTIRIRLIVCSIDKAEQVGLDWWKYDRYLAPGRASLANENQTLRKQIALLERKVDALSQPRANGNNGQRARPTTTGTNGRSKRPGAGRGAR
jgi:hypothetical protein